MAKTYNRDKNVLDAARERMEYVFNHSEVVVVSCSGGKDSTVIFYLAVEIAQKLNRKFYLFYLDQEIEYSYTIELLEYFMKFDCVIPLWFQVPCLLTNTSSISQNIIDPWNPAKKDKWIRGQKKYSIKSIDWEVNVPYTFPKEKMYGFYGLIQCMEQLFKGKKVGQILGIRADESLDRFRAVTKNPAIEGIKWSTKGKYNTKFYPIYDWRFEDIWIYFAKYNLRYNRLYDLFYAKGLLDKDMRLSNLLHEKAYECLSILQEFEPKTIDAMLDRVSGIATAQEYAGRGGSMYKADKLPKEFKSWTEYRDYLLDTMENREHANIFQKRYSKQHQNDYVIKQQVNRILIYDVNNFKKINNAEEDPSVAIRKKWLEIL